MISRRKLLKFLGLGGLAAAPVAVKELPKPKPVHPDDGKLYCDVCGECLTEPLPSEGLMTIGYTSIAALNIDIDRGIQAERLKQTYGATKFSFCYPCVVKALGVKPI